VNRNGKAKANTERITLRGFAKKDGDQWVAICIDLDIAAQAATAQEATGLCIDLCFDYLEHVCQNYPDTIAEFVPRFAPRAIRDEYDRLVAQSLQPRSERPVVEATLYNFDIDPTELTGRAA
jgi:hypothetical protein